MHMSRGGYIKLERDERRLTSDYIERAAKVYGVPEAAVIAEPRRVPIIGVVGDGAEVHFEKARRKRDAIAPTSATDKTVALEIQTDALGELFDRWLVFYDDVFTSMTAELVDQTCVVYVTERRALIRKPQPSKAPGAFHLLAQGLPPMFDVPVRKVARVRLIAAPF
jgi:repressor LexA